MAERHPASSFPSVFRIYRDISKIAQILMAVPVKDEALNFFKALCDIKRIKSLVVNKGVSPLIFLKLGAAHE